MSDLFVSSNSNATFEICTRAAPFTQDRRKNRSHCKVLLTTLPNPEVFLIIAVDVHYLPDGSATAAGVLFRSWESEGAEEEFMLRIKQAAPYVPGKFYLRELPCILQLLATVQAPYQCIVIDGYVHLGKERSPGLGMHLWRSLDGRVPVIGVAKSPFRCTPEEARLLRGSSRRPLFVTAVGVQVDEAKESIARMRGENRIPALLKRVDRLCRKSDGSGSPA